MNHRRPEGEGNLGQLPPWNLKIMTSYTVPVKNILKFSHAPSALIFEESFTFRFKVKLKSLLKCLFTYANVPLLKLGFSNCINLHCLTAVLGLSQSKRLLIRIRQALCKCVARRANHVPLCRQGVQQRRHRV